MSYVQQNHDGPLAHVVLDRPDKSNAFDETMIDELIKTFSDLDTDKNVHVIVISSSGKHFCAGADLYWMKKMVNFSEQENYIDAMKLAKLYQTLNNVSKPIVCAVDGAVYGGGLGLIATSDIVLATKRSTFCFSEVKLGLAPATISPYVVSKIGAHQARRYFLTAEVFDAQVAQQINLVHSICTRDTIEQKVDEVVGKLLQNGPEAMARTKDLLRSLHPISDELIDMTSKLIAECRVSIEAQHGIHAFFEKRQPDWAN